MAIEETIQRALAALADKSHKVNALPVSADVLRVLDHRGLIEFRTWTPSNQGRGPDGMEVYTPWTFGWFSPASSHGSTLEEILRKGTADGQEYISEVRLSQKGAALLAESRLSSNRPADDGKEKDTPPRSRKPSELQEHEQQAYLLYYFTGRTQQQVAEELTKRYHRPFTQPHVSKMIKKAKEVAEAGGLTLPEPAKREKAMDPAKLELGQRTDHRTPHQRPRPK